ncbi:MAG: hypothetical protein ACEQSB_06795, partial [Undibacterium sp.]
MNLREKIMRKRIDLEKVPQQDRKENGQWKKSKRDCFLLWGEYPKGWQMIKDSILCIMLMNALIGCLQEVDWAYYLAPKTMVFVQETTIAPAQAAVIAEEKAPEIKPEPKDGIAAIVAKVHQLES